MEGLRVRNIFWTPPWQRNLEQFLLIQQFWLMGTTSIPQPVITTAQFPISARHAGMPHKSSPWAPIFRHFWGPSPPTFYRTCWVNMLGGRILHSDTGDLDDVIVPYATTPMPARTGIVGKKLCSWHPRDRGPICLFRSIPTPRFDWQPLLSRVVAVASFLGSGNGPFPFRGSPWEPLRICAMPGWCPGAWLKWQTTFPKEWIDSPIPCIGLELIKLKVPS